MFESSGSWVLIFRKSPPAGRASVCHSPCFCSSPRAAMTVRGRAIPVIPLPLLSFAREFEAPMF